MVRATLVYLFIALYVVLLSPVAALWLLAFKDERLPYALARFCIRCAGWLSGVRVLIDGQSKIAPGITYLFLANHQGNFDGPVLLHAIPRNCKALIKKEMMQLPILSFLMKRANFVPIDRLNPKQAQAGIELGAQLLAKGYSFIAFPEGTRSRNGLLGEFKKGAFVMAIKAQVPIVPVTILNSAAIQPPGKYSIRPGCIRVVFHDPIPTAGMELEDRNRLVDLTRKAIATGLSASVQSVSNGPWPGS